MTVLTTIVVTLAIMLALFGIGVAAWSVIDTRRRYYEEYLSRRKRSDAD